MANDLAPLLGRQSLIVYILKRADAIFQDRFLQLSRVDPNVLISTGGDRIDHQICHLADFLFERHTREQRFHTKLLVTGWFGGNVRGLLKEKIAITEVIGLRFTVVLYECLGSLYWQTKALHTEEARQYWGYHSHVIPLVLSTRTLLIKCRRRQGVRSRVQFMLGEGSVSDLNSKPTPQPLIEDGALPNGLKT